MYRGDPVLREFFRSEGKFGTGSSRHTLPEIDRG
jgi:hypothetical protein